MRSNLDEDDDDRGRGRGRDRYRDEDRRHKPHFDSFLYWGTARAGLGLTLVGSIFISIGFILNLIFLLSFEQRQFGGFDRDEGLVILAQIGQLLLGLGGMMWILSLFMSGGAPSESGASGFSIGTRISFLSVLVTVLIIMATADRGFGRGNTGEFFLYIIIAELALMMIFWSLYLRAVAVYVGNSGAAAGAIIFMIVSLIGFGLNVFTMLSRNPFGEGKTMVLITSGLGVGMFIFQAILSGTIRGSLSDFLLRELKQLNR